MLLLEVFVTVPLCASADVCAGAVLGAQSEPAAQSFLCFAGVVQLLNTGQLPADFWDWEWLPAEEQTGTTSIVTN